MNGEESRQKFAEWDLSPAKQIFAVATKPVAHFKTTKRSGQTHG